MTQHRTTKVLFIKVTDNTTKLQRITHLIHDHFLRGDTILITVPSDEAATYIDGLLWRSPEESFIPHTIAHGPSTDRVVISTIASNINGAQIILNLVPTVPSHINDCHTVYDLLDLTHPAKEELSSKRINDYKTQNLLVDII